MSRNLEEKTGEIKKLNLRSCPITTTTTTTTTNIIIIIDVTIIFTMSHWMFLLSYPLMALSAAQLVCELFMVGSMSRSFYLCTFVPCMVLGTELGLGKHWLANLHWLLGLVAECISQKTGGEGMVGGGVADCHSTTGSGYPAGDGTVCIDQLVGRTLQLHEQWASEWDL